METQDLTWKTPPMQRGKTTGASQQTLLTIIRSWVTTPCGGLQDHQLGGTLIWVYVPYRTGCHSLNRGHQLYIGYALYHVVNNGG
jgi:hypothetical protein